MEAIYVQAGDSIDYTPTTAVAAGQVVVQGDLIGVAKQPIAANTLGSLAVSGVFDFAKGTSAISVGSLVYWDNTAKVATMVATGNKLLGKAVSSATALSTTVRVRLSQ